MTTIKITVVKMVLTLVTAAVVKTAKNDFNNNSKNLQLKQQT
jgi:hypothetical protein